MLLLRNHFMFKNILIFGHSNLGDVCYDLTVVAPVCRQFPGAKISFLTSPRASGVVEGYKGLDHIIIFNKKGGDGGLWGRLRFVMKLRKKKFDLVIVLKKTFMHKFLFVNNVWSARDYLGCCPSNDPRHVVDIYLDFLRSYNVNVSGRIFDFYVGKKEHTFADAFLSEHNIRSDDTIVGILPAAAWPLKNWPIDKWNELARLLKDKHNIRVISFSKSGGNSFAEMVVRNLSHDVIVVDNLSLKQVKAFITRCDLFISPDSGLLHIASCMGINVIGLYGATPPDHIYPYFHQNNILVSKEKYDCAPCYPGTQPCLRKTKFQVGACMDAIRVKDVLDWILLQITEDPCLATNTDVESDNAYSHC